MNGAALLIILVYFIIIVTFLTLLWRIVQALDKINDNLKDMSKTLASRSDDKK